MRGQVLSWRGLAWIGIIPRSPPQIHRSAAGGEPGQCVRQREFALCVLKKELCDSTTFATYLAKLFHTVLFLCISKVIHKVVQVIKKKIMIITFILYFENVARGRVKYFLQCFPNSSFGVTQIWTCTRT